MRSQSFKYVLSSVFALSASFLYGQSSESSGNLGYYSLIGVVVLLFLWALTSLTDNFMTIEAKKAGLDTRNNNFGLFPSIGGFFGKKAPDFADVSRFVKLSKGADIKLAGEATKTILNMTPTRVAIQPNLFNGVSPIPKLEVEIGSEVKAGDAVMFDKVKPNVKFVSPVSGEVVELIRGDKRAIHKLVILADKEIQYKKFNPPSLDSDRSELTAFMQESGLWTLLNRRPYDVIPAEDSVPRDIFISTFDTAPLAPDNDFVVQGNEVYFQKGLDVLAKLTPGKVFLGLNGNQPSASAFTNAEGVEKYWFAGKHPAGNVGVQIHHTKPIKSGEEVWTVKVQDVVTIGKMFVDGIYDASKIVAVCGNEVSTPQYIKTIAGASLSDILSSQALGEKARIIGGDVLSGRSESMDGFLTVSDDQITVIKEGDEHELFGWLLPIKPRPSLSNTFPNFLYPDHKFEANTNTHGEKRAFVVSGQYEEVLPMDIYPQHLMKAILANDVEKMEGLGINELSEEDLALCEFACTSKMPLQQILRKGLNTMRAEE